MPTSATPKRVGNYPPKSGAVANLAFLEGLSVDEAFTLFNDDFGVRKSKEMRREKIEMQRNYNAEGLYGGVADVVDKGETSHTENINLVKSI